MAAATFDRNTPIADLQRLKGPYVLGSGVTVYAGTIAAIAGATGLVAVAGDTAAQRVVGFHLKRAVYDAALTDPPEIAAGSIWLNNDGNITAAMLGQKCYVLDDQTVTTAAVATNDIAAGTIEQVDATLGVLVRIDNPLALAA